MGMEEDLAQPTAALQSHPTSELDCFHFFMGLFIFETGSQIDEASLQLSM